MMLIEKLRNKTRAYHDSLDSHPELSKITSDQVKLSDYTSYLQLFWGIHSIVEDEIRKNLSTTIDYEGRLELIDLDLYHLHEDHPENIARSFHLESKSAIGAYYVLEGSKLGGKMIAKRLRDNLSLNKSYLNFLSHPSTYSWKTVVDHLNNVSPKDHQEVINGAEHTFSFILSYVQDYYSIEEKAHK